jgi:hypothetical protein
MDFGFWVLLEGFRSGFDSWIELIFESIDGVSWDTVVVPRLEGGSAAPGKFKLPYWLSHLIDGLPKSTRFNHQDHSLDSSWLNFQIHGYVPYFLVYYDVEIVMKHEEIAGGWI